MKINLDFIYPIGSIYMSVNAINPEILFGGTWVAWGTGRVPVGVDTSQTEFATVEKTGGSKYMQKHTHGARLSAPNSYNTSGGSHWLAEWRGVSDAGNTAYIVEAGTGNSGNLQPYITCYMWKRTA